MFRIINIKGIKRCVVYILQAREIIERSHLISVYRVNVKLPYLSPGKGLIVYLALNLVNNTRQ